MPRRSAALIVVASLALACRRPTTPTDSTPRGPDAGSVPRADAAPAIDAGAAFKIDASAEPVVRATCRLAADLAPWRYSPSVTVLADGRVLIVGGRQHDTDGVVGGLDQSSAAIEVCRFAASDVAPRNFRDEALEAAGLAPGDARDEVRPWGGLEDGAVALRVETSSVDARGGHITVKLGALERADGKMRTVASTTSTIERDDCVQSAGPADGPTAMLDLAPYRLDATTVAVGVRVACGRTFPAGEGASTTLHLFRIQGAALVRIFDGEVKNYDVQRGPGDLLESSAIVATEPRGGAMADLVVRKTISRSRIGDAAAPKRTGETIRFAFDGTRYVKK